MKVVVIGASGNVGSALLRRLAAAGGYEVTGISRREPPRTPPYDIYGWHTLDLAKPSAEANLRPALSGAECVVHLAWGFQPARDHDYLERLGVGGLRAVVSAAEGAGVSHLIHMSSVGTYSPGAHGRQVAESWPRDGVPTSAYSRHKAAAERVLDEHEDRLRISRPRPGLILHGDAGSSLLRYALPALIPSRAVGWLPLLPLDRSFTVPIVHSDDVAAAIEAMIRLRAGGPFNLAASAPLTREMLAAALRARPVHVPAKAIRLAVTAGWHARLHRLDPGWIDLAFAVPLLDTARARTDLAWSPQVDAADAIRELVLGMTEGASTPSPVLRERRVVEELANLQSGPPTERPLT